MAKYKKRIFDLHPLWLEMYGKLFYPKVKILNNGKGLGFFEKKLLMGF